MEIVKEVIYSMQVCILHGMCNSLPSLMFFFALETPSHNCTSGTTGTDGACFPCHPCRCVWYVFFLCHMLQSKPTHGRLGFKVWGYPAWWWTCKCVHLEQLTWMHSNIPWACNHITVLGTVPPVAMLSIFIWHPGLHQSPLCIAWGKWI